MKSYYLSNSKFEVNYFSNILMQIKWKGNILRAATGENTRLLGSLIMEFIKDLFREPLLYDDWFGED